MNVIDGFVSLTKDSWNCPDDSPHEEFDESLAQQAGIAMPELQRRIGQALGSIPDADLKAGAWTNDFIATFTQGYLMARYVERLAQRAGLQ